MPKTARLAAMLVALCLVLAAAGPALAQEPVHMHYFVVPAQTAGGQELATVMDQFKLGLAQLAGGYTELGLSNGGAMDQGSLVKEINFSFLVAAPADISAELAALISQHFATSAPFIVHWTGERFTGAH